MPSPQKEKKATAWEEAEAYGFDMSLIESNLRKTPQERIRQHSHALASALLLRQAMEKNNEQHRSPSQPIARS